MYQIDLDETPPIILRFWPEAGRWFADLRHGIDRIKSSSFMLTDSISNLSHVPRHTIRTALINFGGMTKLPKLGARYGPSLLPYVFRETDISSLMFFLARNNLIYVSAPCISGYVCSRPPVANLRAYPTDFVRPRIRFRLCQKALSVTRVLREDRR